MKHLINLDTETTGLNNPDVIEMAFIKYDNVECLMKDFDININVWEKRYKPTKAIEAGAFRTHGIKLQDLKDCSSCTTIDLHEILAIPEDDEIIIIGSNPKYDYGALKKPKNVSTLDIKPIVKAFLPDRRSYALSRLFTDFCKILGKNEDFLPKSHSASGDVLRVDFILRTLFSNDVHYMREPTEKDIEKHHLTRTVIISKITKLLA